MSANSNEQGAGQAASGSVGTLQLPRLPAGGVGYAAWAASVDVSLERAGAAGIHRKPMAKEQWEELAARVDAWREEELSAAIALTIGGAAQGSSSSSSAPSAPLSKEAKEARTLVASTVACSRRVYGMLYASLPEELRAQVAHLPQGWAHGLWTWLAAKFQSTEADSVGVLLGQFFGASQGENESFDAYRARVNQLRTLLEAAKEKPSARQYAWVLLDKLQPRYVHVVLALKANGQLADAENIAWDSVAALVNAHERQEQRIGADGGDSAAMAAAARGGSDGFQTQRSKRGGFSGGGSGSPPPSGDRDRRRGGGQGGFGSQRGGHRGAGSAASSTGRRQCFRCDRKGHVAAVCPYPPKENDGKPAGSRGGEHASAATHGASNHFDALSSDDDAEVESQSGRAALAGDEWPRRASSERACMTVRGILKDKTITFAEAVKGRGKAATVGKVATAAVAPPVTATAQVVAASSPVTAPTAASVKPQPTAAPVAGSATSVSAPPKTPPVTAPVAAASVVAAAPAKAQPEAVPSAASVPVVAPSAVAPAAKLEAGMPPAVPPTASSCVPRSEQAQAVKVANSAPTLATLPTKPNGKPKTSAQLDAMLSDNSWGWDTMASACCSGNRALFVTRRQCAPVPVKLADHSVVRAAHVGSVVLRVAADDGRTVRILIDNVLYHPSFGANLLSGELLTKTLGWQYHSTPEESYVVTPGGSRVTISTRGRVAVLVGVSAERACSVRLCASAAAGVSAQNPLQDVVVQSLVRLHQRLLHCGWTRMIHMLRSDRVLDHGFDLAELTSERLKVAEAQVRQCTACVQGKATRTPFGHRGLDRGTKPCEVLHMDTYFVKVQQPDGREAMEYGLAVKDMFSGHMWHAQRMTKDRITDAVIEIVLQAETQFGCTVKRLRSDGGSEFVNQKLLQDFCAKRGKKLHWTPPGTQQLNSGAERTVRTFKECGRTMLHHAGAPLRLWKYAAAHAAFVWNRMHISADTGMTPYEALRGKKPSLRHIGVFGCDVFRHVPKEQRSALASKVDPGIYLGHNDAQNAAYVLLLASNKVIASRDVTFRSDSFAFMRALERGDDGVRDAQQLCANELEAEVDDIAEDSAPAQGGLAPPSSAEARPAANEEYVVDSILGKRTRNGRVEYKVHWAGYDASEDSWEPEDAVSDLAAMDAWLAQQQQQQQQQQLPPVAAGAAAGPAAAHAGAEAPGPRRSPRLAEHASAVRDSDEDDEPQVHMAMCALRRLQLPDERPDEVTAMAAVASGIAALEQRTPNTYREAMASPDAPQWREALAKEMRSCTEQQVWTLVRRADLPAGSNVLPCKEVFKIKVNERGEVTEFKARFTPKGFRQKYGKDFFDTFARTGQYKTLRVALSLVAKWDHELQQFDVPTAFLNAPVEEDIYMELPAGFEQAGMVCKLQKSLYGLKQAPRNWDRLVHQFITGDMAFKATVSDPSLYVKRSRSGRLMMIYRFVDDMQGSHHADDAAEFAESVALLQARFNIKQLKTATWMLGMRITRDRKARTITLDQELYVSKALEKFGFEQCRSVSAPEMVGAAHDANPALDGPTDAQRYMEMTGTLMYAAISTRPDIAHAVHYLASHMQAPTARHMQAAERVFRYLAGTKDVGLVFGSRNGGVVGDSRGWRTAVQVDVCAFSDADWANDKGDRRSVTGWVAKLNGDPVSWSSKKQRVVALSTCEAELYAEAAAIQEVLWLRGLMQELGLHTQTGSTVYGDNQSALAVSANGVKGERTKHVDVKYHFVTETVERGVVTLRWVPTAQQQADIFTKALATPVFTTLRKQLMTR